MTAGGFPVELNKARAGHERSRKGPQKHLGWNDAARYRPPSKGSGPDRDLEAALIDGRVVSLVNTAGKGVARVIFSVLTAQDVVVSFVTASQMLHGAAGQATAPRGIIPSKEKAIGGRERASTGSPLPCRELFQHAVRPMGHSRRPPPRGLDFPAGPVTRRSQSNRGLSAQSIGGRAT